MAKKINKFAILGERCSGTNFLENVITTNFGLELSNEYSWKHFFGFDKFDKPNEDTLFIGIVRNPIYWLNSFSKELHHIPKKNRPLNNFLFNEFYSIDDNNKIITNDVNYATNKKYKNIFELRKMKNFYLINIMKYKVKNYILINYESLLFNYEYTLDFMKDKFNLSKKFPMYKKIKKYKKSNKDLFHKQRNILLSPKTVSLIWNNLHVEQENRLGYFKGDNNEYLKSKDNIKFITS